MTIKEGPVNSAHGFSRFVISPHGFFKKIQWLHRMTVSAANDACHPGIHPEPVSRSKISQHCFKDKIIRHPNHQRRCFS
jgi:hypothetical protein